MSVTLRSKVAQQRAAGAARRWAATTFGELERALPGCVHRATLDTGAVRIALRTDNSELLDALRLQWFGLLRSADADNAGSAAAPAADPAPLACEATLTVCHALPRGFGVPHHVLEQQRRAAAALRAVEAEYAARAEQPTEGRDGGDARAHFGALGAKRAAVAAAGRRWLAEPLADGVVAQRVELHAGLSAPELAPAVSAAAALGRPLAAHRVGPCVAASGDRARWAVFGSVPGAPECGAVDAAGVTRVAELAHAGVLLGQRGGAWVNCAAVGAPGSGDAVLLVGPRGCGKTTLALHCLAMDARASLVAAQRAVLFPQQQPRRGGDAATAAAVSVSSMPHDVAVGTGALLGTLQPNSALQAVAARAGLQALARNSDAVLWNLGRASHAVNVAEAFGGPHRVLPTARRVAAVVVLNWDTLDFAGRLMGRTCDGARSAAATLRTVEQLGAAHSLLRELPMPLDDVLGVACASTPVFELAGAVKFEAAAKFVLGKLFSSGSV